MKLKFIIVSILSLFLLTGFFGGGKQTVKLNTTSGYSTEAWLYKAKEFPKEVGIVFLHGKRGNPESDHNKKFIKNIRKIMYLHRL